MTAALPFSQSRAWELQRAFYAGMPEDAFSDIPHHVVDNPFVSAALARVVVGFLRDWAREGLDPSEPVFVVELGAGAGRFAHGFLAELGRWTDALPFALPEIVYVMTDLGESTLAGWEANPALADPRLDFARFDVSADATLKLRRRGTELSAAANPVVAIGTYLLDSVPVDAFAIGDGDVQECLLDVTGDDVPSMELTWSRRPVPAGRYADPELTALLDHYAHALRDTVVTIPHVGLGCVERLRALAGDRLLLLSADKAHCTLDSLAHRSEPELSRHGGSFSLMVNFHAFEWYAQRHGGAALHGGDRHSAVDVGALLFGAPAGGYAETRLAYADAIARFSPEDFSFLSEGMERVAAQLELPELVALLRLSGWDAFTFHGLVGPLRELAGEADPAAQDDLRNALQEIHERHFPVPGEDDLPFAIGLILFELEEFEDAIALFEESLALHGPDESTERNIAICRTLLGQDGQMSDSP